MNRDDEELLEDLLHMQRNNKFMVFLPKMASEKECFRFVRVGLNYNDPIMANTYKRVWNVAWLIKGSIQLRNFGQEMDFPVTLKMEKFANYMTSWCRLWVKGVNFGKWHDLGEEGLNLLRDLLDEDQLENYENDPRYISFMEKFAEQHGVLRKTGESQLNEHMDE